MDSFDKWITEKNNTDSHWMSNPTLSRLQEVIFDLYDENLIIFAQRLERVEQMLIADLQSKEKGKNNDY